MLTNSEGSLVTIFFFFKVQIKEIGPGMEDNQPPPALDNQESSCRGRGKSLEHSGSPEILLHQKCVVNREYMTDCLATFRQVLHLGVKHYSGKKSE